MCIATAAVLTVTASTRADVPAIYNLGTLGGSASVPAAINSSGQVVGQSTAATAPPIEENAFLYSGIPGSGGAMSNLGTLPGDISSAAQGINDSGQIAGFSAGDGELHPQAFFDSGGTMTPLGTLGGNNSEALGINANGEMTGWSTLTTTSGTEHAFRYVGTPGVNGAMIDIGTLGGTNSQGLAINASGKITGMSDLSGDNVQDAFLYTKTLVVDPLVKPMKDLGNLGGTFSTGTAINASGQVAGYSQTSSGADHVFIYTGGHMLDLGTLGGENSFAYGMDDDGDIVGGSTPQGAPNAGFSDAFVYFGTPGSGGRMADLNLWLDGNNPTEGAKWDLETAIAITDSGWITGTGFYDDGVTSGERAFLLDASSLIGVPATLFPEPTSLSLVAICGFAAVRRRRV
jgi:probable HAF family extracellular repeat protein